MSIEVRNPPERAPDCLVCAYFRVTWDPAFPRACDVFGIKTRNLPSYDVFAATGRHCPAWERKVPEAGNARASPPPDDEGGIWA